ncbi:hypothetical protein EAH68_03700 [Corynebacterium hylobatis]|uniref:Uncharacterized protein n=1 Tax=Corynebacterium hylobatis TaxID=1859290 RepID=A0A430I1A0_9CORY|nr:DUF732 domain-containing protein [Corynebacterium hylobatis]RSZ64714.1 hypothetical protein EAH68_03700 [Corynebacterium hylobatis]
MSTPARTGLIIAALTGTLTLTACGGATVENDPTTATSVAPLERAPKNDVSEESPETGEPGRRPPTGRPAEPQPQDQGAQEIDEVPEQQTPRSPEDVTFLGDLTDEGIDVEGVEDQLIGTASTVCGGGGNVLTEATPPAVAGQLVEQGRTDLPVGEVTALIESTAKNAYC